MSTGLGLGAGALWACLSGNALAEEPELGGHELETKLRLVHFDREFENSSGDRDQSALGIQLNYTSPRIGDVVGVGISGYAVTEIQHSGAIREDVLAVDDGKQSGLAKFGQAYVDFVWGDRFSARFGRQLHKSMFLNSSTSRAIPNTFQGASASLDVTEQLSFHGAVYDKWSRRARNEFEGFATDRSGEGDIDFVAVLGAKYEVGGVTVEGEYLESDDFMRKFGLRGTYVHMLADSSLRFTGGVFTSSDAGSLFVTGSESGDLDDEDVTGSVAGVTRSEVDGLGGYVETAWKKGNVEIAGAFTVIDEIWLEDNFTGDHGRNPFPTRSRVGPDLTNSNEKVVGARVSYNWKDIVPGLRTDLAAAYGFDAENSANSALGSADENWWELRVRYKLPMVKGLSFTGIYHDYNSDETGRVDGVKQDERDIRLYLDYVYTFK